MVASVARSTGEQTDVDFDLDRLEIIRRFAERWQRHGGHVTTLHRVLSYVDVAASPTMPYDLFGVVAGLKNDQGEWRWRIRLNAHLPIAARHASLGHEFTHTFQFQPAAGFKEAPCQPYGELPPLEQEAHVGGALFTVPYRAIADLAFGDMAAAKRLALELQVPASYVRLRNAIAVPLGEKDGSPRIAEAQLNAAMLAHQVWMSRIADYLQTIGQTEPASATTG